MSLESQTSSNVRPTLKEVMKEHWEKSDFQVSHETVNMGGVTFFLYSILFFPLINITWLMPTIYDDWSAYGWRCFLSIFLMVQCFMNWRRCTQSHDDIVICPHCKAHGFVLEKQKILAARENGKSYCDQWKYCVHCQVETPPRAHHCKVCQMCILKRDHHCYFTTRCIGYYTQRRFIVLCFYIFLACCMFSYHCFFYLNSTDSVHFLDYILPITVLKFIFAGVKLKFLFITINFYLSVAFGGLAIVYLLWEFLLIIDNKTSYEAAKVINRYRQSIGDNVRSVFGNYFLIHFIWPFNTALPLDGFNWPLHKCFKEH